MSKTSKLASFRPRPLPERLSLLLQEARWLILGVMSLYVGLVLLGYSAGDPGWSHAAEVERVANPGGRFGAWLADLLFYLFGFSAWWWVIFLGYGLVWGYRRFRNEMSAERHSFLFILVGFLVLLLASGALEALRFHSHGSNLPQGPGGLLGMELSKLVQHNLGFTGGTLLLLALVATGISLFTGLSWLALLERLGESMERGWFALMRAKDEWLARRAGRQAAVPVETVADVRRKSKEEPSAPTQRIEPVVPASPPVTTSPPEAPVAPAVAAAFAAEAPARGPTAAPTMAPATPPAPAPAAPVMRPIKTSKPATVERAAPLQAGEEGGLPPLSLLDPASTDVEPPSAEILESTARLIETRLGDFGVEVKVVGAYAGPVVTRYEIEPATGVKGSQVVNLAKDLSRALSLVSIRVVETVPGKSCMALELPNARRQTVRLSEILGSKAYQAMGSSLTVALGMDIGGQPVVADLAKMPHLLVAGTTGSGKSVGINAMILSLLYKSDPSQVRLIMVDPKMLELSIYEGIPHLLAPVVTDMKHAANALNWCVVEMDKRYKLMAAVGVRNLAGFNKAVVEARNAEAPLTNPFAINPDNPEPLETLPHIVVIVDELADMMMVVGKKVEELIARLAQKARAAGIHLILATQRPSVDVITGLIKANVPTRIAFQVSSKIDSRTILDQMGAETLLGMGDMLYLAPGTGVPVRVHGAFVADDEVHHVVDHLKQFGEPDYVEGILSAPDDGAEGGLGGADGDDVEADPLYDQAVEIVLKTRRPSISLVQRHLRIGYNRSARLIEQMERAGLVSSMGSNGNREVLVPAKEGE